MKKKISVLVTKTLVHVLYNERRTKGEQKNQN